MHIYIRLHYLLKLVTRDPIPHRNCLLLLLTSVRQGPTHLGTMVELVD